MKGIILAGGNGTRLYPITKSISKQLIPVYDKPMIYYPLSVLMLAGIREILLIINEKDFLFFKELLGDGKDFGLKIDYAFQKNPNGIGEAFLIGEKFIGTDSVALILGDNIFFGNNFSGILNKSRHLETGVGAKIFAYPVKDASSYGIVELDKENKIISLVEKPKKPKSNFAVPGLYFFDNSVIEKAKKINFSERKELEIIEINKMYLAENKLSVSVLGRGMVWFDTGTPEALLEASNFVEAVQKRQGFYIACIEEIAYRKGFIDRLTLEIASKRFSKTEYGKYLKSLL